MSQPNTNLNGVPTGTYPSYSQPYNQAYGMPVRVSVSKLFSFRIITFFGRDIHQLLMHHKDTIMDTLIIKLIRRFLLDNSRMLMPPMGIHLNLLHRRCHSSLLSRLLHQPSHQPRQPLFQHFKHGPPAQKIMRRYQVGSWN